MMVRIAVVVLLLGLVAVARPAPAQASYGECLIDHYIEWWLISEAIFQAYLGDEFPIGDEIEGSPLYEIKGFPLEVTRVWKGKAPSVVTTFTDDAAAQWHRYSHVPRFRPLVAEYDFGDVNAHRVEYLIHYWEGVPVVIEETSYCNPRASAEDFAGSELAAVRIMYYSERALTVVMAAVLALILRAAWRRRARW